MARVELRGDDPANRMTLHTLLQVGGHDLVADSPDVIVSDNIPASVELLDAVPVLVLASASQIRDAIAAMQKGVYGYIFVPLQPGEADLMVRRAMGTQVTESAADTRPLLDIELEHIQTVLRECKGNRTKAARVLGVGRNTLWRKLKKNAK